MESINCYYNINITEHDTTLYKQDDCYNDNTYLECVGEFLNSIMNLVQVGLTCTVGKASKVKAKVNLSQTKLPIVCGTVSDCPNWKRQVYCKGIH